MSQTRKNILSGVKWNAFGQISRQTINFALMIILTRILSPNEFGQIGILLVFIGIADVFINSGLSVALIQQKSKSTKDLSTVFFFNLFVSLLFYLLLFISAPFIANYFNQPELVQLCRVLSLVFIINALGTVQSTILTIDLNFKKQNIISLLGVLVSAIVSLYMANSGYKTFSLVGQILAFAITTNIILWVSSYWRPVLVFDISSFKRLFKFGSNILLSSILDKIFTTIDNLIIGKVFNTMKLGYYTRAKSTRDLPIVNTTGILSSVFFPVFIKIEDRSELIRLHLKTLGIISYIILPLMAGLYLVSEPLTIIMFTEKWKASIPMLQILVIYGPLYPLSVILVQTLLVIGKSKVFLKLDVFKKVILLLFMFIGLFYSIETFLIFICIGHYIGFFLNILVLSRELNIKITDYLTSFKTSFFTTTAMIVIVLLIGCFSFSKPLFLLLSQVAGGIISYISISIIFKIKEFVFLEKLFLQKLRSK